MQHIDPMLVQYIDFHYCRYITETRQILSPHRRAIVETATELLGSHSTRYTPHHPELGQSPDTGFDCSGFAQYVLSRAGLHIPDYIGMDNVQRPIRHASEFWDHYGVTVGTEPQGGDLIFFSRHGTFPTHIGIMKDDKNFIHAPGKPDTTVCIEPLTYEDIPLHRSERLLYARNPIGFKAPTLPHDSPTYRYHQQIA